MKKSFIMLSMALLHALILFSGFKYPLKPADYWFDYITGHFQNYMLKFHQNKVYLQTDKNEYETGENIFFKAWVLNNAEKKPENVVKNVYVEMISPEKGAFMTRMLKIENGMAKGDFPVLDTVYTGLYQIRAYTPNMKNSGKEYLFVKEIRISHPSKLFYNKMMHKKAKKLARKDPQYDLQFFPEGGHWVDKIKTVLAFKATNQSGYGFEAEGKIFTSSGEFICNFKSEHKGMGKMEFTPEFGKKYYALLENVKGKKVKYKLPAVIQKSYAIHIQNNTETFAIEIKTDKTFGADAVARTVYLFVQSGGKIYHSERYEFENNQISLKLEKKQFPSGVVHFTLFDAQGKPQCERLAFVDHQDRLKIKTQNTKSEYKKREKIEFETEISAINQMEQNCELAISVRPKSTFGFEYPDIRTYMLLCADIKGHIEDPEFYFSKNENSSKYLDLLMLTQGWRKFLWQDILKESISKPEFPVETDIRVSGRITKYLFDIPVRNVSLTMTMLNQFNDVYKTRSGEKGYFEFPGLNYSDTIDVLIEARTRLNRKNILILIDEQRELGTDFNPFKGFYLDSLQKRRKLEYKKPPEPEEDPNKPKDYKIHSEADQVIVFTDQMRAMGQNVLDVIRSRVPGLKVGADGANMRGNSTLFGNNNPLFLIDGMPTDFNGIQTLNVQDVDYVEILKGPSAAIYGLRGANGVIAVYTKKGIYYKRGEIRFKMYGYHTAKKFYSPKYQPTDEPGDLIDARKTIYWAPSLKTNENGKAQIEFYHSDVSGEFEIVIEAMNSEGIMGTYKTSYWVKD